MFRTMTLAAAALVAATSIAVAEDNIFVSLAMQDDDRAAVRALTQTNSARGGSDAIFVDLAMQDDDRAAVRALRGETGAGVAFSSKGGSISALEVAYKHAVENDDRQLAKHLAANLGL